MRPLYETKANLEQERSIALLFEQTYRCSLQKLPIRYHLDFAITQDDQIKAFLEIKTTKYTMDQHRQYGGFKISLAKWYSAEQMCRVADVPFILLVDFPDKPRFLRVDDFKHDGLTWWGRTDRGDTQDMEPSVILNIDKFIEVR